MNKAIPFKFELTVDNEITLFIPDISLATVIYEKIDNDRKHLSEWLPWVSSIVSPEKTKENIQHRILGFKTGQSASFYARYKGNIVASVGFNHLDKNNQQGELGYWILSDYQGLGIITKSINACIDYAFTELKINKIIIKCAKENSKSIAVAKRLGFKEEALLKEDRFTNNTLSDTLIFSLQSRH